MASTSKKFRKHTPTEITRLLNEKQLQQQSATEFCKLHGISKQTCYNWEKKYSVSIKSDFIPLVVDTTVAVEPVEPTPFCEILVSTKTRVRFFEPVTSQFLKSLIY